MLKHRRKMIKPRRKMIKPRRKMISAKKMIKHKRKIFASLKFDFFRVQLKFAFRIRTLVLLLDMVFPIGEKKHGYRLALAIVATTRQGNVGFAVAEAVVIPPRQRLVLDLVQRRIRGIKNNISYCRLLF